MSVLHPSLYALRDAFRTYVTAQAPDIEAFCGAALRAQHCEVALAVTDLPATQYLTGLAGMACPATLPIVDALLDAAPHLQWRQSYSEADDGFDAHYLAHYGWFNLIAPSGPFVSDDLRLSIGYWGKGLHYPWHWHAPEEIYLTLAGSARYISEGRADVSGGPGAIIAHVSNQPHAADMAEAPLLAAAFWRGDDLESKPGLPEESAR